MFTSEMLAADNMAVYITGFLRKCQSVRLRLSLSRWAMGIASTKFETSSGKPYIIINSYYWRNLATLNPRLQYAFTLVPTIS